MNGEDKHIIIVDDEKEIIDLLTIILKSKKFNVASFNSAKDVLEYIKKDNPVDLILSDVRMPEMTGIELLEEIKKMNIFIPVVGFITGHCDLSVEEAYDLGIGGFLRKPFKKIDVLTLVERSINSFPKFQKTFDQNLVSFQINLDYNSFDDIVKQKKISLGQGGFFLNTEEIAPINSLVEFNISFKEGTITKLNGIGEIAWTRDTDKTDVVTNTTLLKGSGIKFINISNDLEKEIDAYIKAHKIRPFIPLS